MDETSLETMVGSYRLSGGSFDAILACIAAKMYENPSRFGFEAEDDVAEVLERYRSRILRLIGRYRDQGAPFEAYLKASIRYLARSLRRERRKWNERQLVCERAECWAIETRLFGQSGESDLQSPEESGPGKGWRVNVLLGKGGSSVPRLAAWKNRIVFLYLKCAWNASDKDTLRVSGIAGMSTGRLAAAVAQARRYLETERQRHERLTLWRDRSWARIRLLEGRLRVESDPYLREQTAASLGRECKRFAHAREALRRFRPVVPNSVVARILDVPKGTVDSGIYYLKKKIPRLEGLADL